MALSAADQQAVAAYFADKMYVGPNNTAHMASDTLATAIGTIDVAIAVSATAVNASISLAATATGKFSVTEFECLVAYVLLRRAGVL